LVGPSAQHADAIIEPFIAPSGRIRAETLSGDGDLLSIERIDLVVRHARARIADIETPAHGYSATLVSAPLRPMSSRASMAPVSRSRTSSTPSKKLLKKNCRSPPRNCARVQPFSLLTS